MNAYLLPLPVIRHRHEIPAYVDLVFARERLESTRELLLMHAPDAAELSQLEETLSRSAEPSKLEAYTERLGEAMADVIAFHETSAIRRSVRSPT